MPGAGQQERPGAVGALGFSGGAAALGEQRRLLIDTCARHGNAAPERRRGAEQLGVAGHPWQGGGVDAEYSACLIAPGAGVEVEEQRAPCGGGIGGECPAQAVEQPGVGGGDDNRFVHVAQPFAQPHHLRCHEIRVEFEAGDGGQARSVRSETIAHHARTAVLPHHRWAHRRTGCPIPCQHGFALVGQAHRLDRGVPRPRECGRTSGQHTRPQFGGVELYRTVGSARDRYCHLRQAQHLGTVDDHRLGGRRALIDREDGHRLRH